jgi:hypothetical protein
VKSPTFSFPRLSLLNLFKEVSSSALPGIQLQITRIQHYSRILRDFCIRLKRTHTNSSSTSNTDHEHHALIYIAHTFPPLLKLPFLPLHHTTEPSPNNSSQDRPSRLYCFPTFNQQKQDHSSHPRHYLGVTYLCHPLPLVHLKNL